MPVIHQLKIKQQYAIKYYEGLKPWEIRKNDRDFKVGDFIDFTIIENSCVYRRKILYVFLGGSYGLSDDYVILTLEH